MKFSGRLEFSAEMQVAEFLSGAVVAAVPDVLGEPAPFTGAEPEDRHGVLGIAHGYRLAVKTGDLDAAVAGAASGASPPLGGGCPTETHSGSLHRKLPCPRPRCRYIKHTVTRSQKTPDHGRVARYPCDRRGEVGPEFRVGWRQAGSSVDPARAAWPSAGPREAAEGGLSGGSAPPHRPRSNSPFLARSRKSCHSPDENDRTGLCVPCLASRAPMEWDEPASAAISTHVLLAPQWALLLHCGAGVAKGDTRCLSQGLSPLADPSPGVFGRGDAPPGFVGVQRLARQA